MFIDWLMETFEKKSGETAIAWKDRTVSYRWLLEAVRRWQERLASSGIRHGDVVAVDGDFSPNAVALMFALIEHRCIMVPLTASVEAKKPEFREIAQAQAQIVLDE